MASGLTTTPLCGEMVSLSLSLTTTPLYGEMVSLLKIKFTLIRRRKLQKDFSLGKTRDALMKVN